MRKLLITTLTLLAMGNLMAQETLNTVVNTLKERISLSGYGQVGYTYDDAVEPNNSFDVKRAILMVDGKITDKWSCYFMCNFADATKLLELYTDYHFMPGLSARMGQFKTPYTFENQLSLSTVELINCYAQATNCLAGVTNADKLIVGNGGRDIGLMIYGDLFKKLVTYKLAVMNGQGINVKDKNNQKDVIGYLMLNPTKWLSIGGSFIAGTGHAMAQAEEAGIAVGQNYSRNRWSAGAILTGSRASLRTEYISGKDNGVRRSGMYATGCVQLIPKLEMIASVDYFDHGRIGNQQANYVAGLQYWFYPKCRLQAQYTRQEPKGGEGSNLIQTQIQVRF